MKVRIGKRFYLKPDGSVFTVDDARTVELTNTQIDLRVSQHWIRPYEGVYRAAGAPQTWRGDLYAAVRAGLNALLGEARDCQVVAEVSGSAELESLLIAPSLYGGFVLAHWNGSREIEERRIGPDRNGSGTRRNFAASKDCRR